MIELNRHESDTIANNPANTVSNKLPKKPMTFRKVLLTIDSISDDLSVVKLYNVDSFISVIIGISVKAESKPLFFIRGDSRS